MNLLSLHRTPGTGRPGLMVLNCALADPRVSQIEGPWQTGVPGNSVGAIFQQRLLTGVSVSRREGK